MDPIVSVVMSNYNHARFLRTRIGSLLAAMPSDSELLIADDHSSDHSEEILREFELKDKRFRWYKNVHNVGVNRSVEKLVPLAKGKYLTLLSADDEILPDFFSKTLDVLENHPKVGLCCSIPGQISLEDKVVVPVPCWRSDQPIVILAQEMVDVFRRTDFWVAGHTVIFRRQLFHRYGGLDERLGPLSDWVMLHAMALEEGIAYIPEALSLFRVSGENYSSSIVLLPYVGALLEKMGQEFRHLKQKFVKSTLLRTYIKPHLGWFAARPKYWNFLVPVARRYFRNRWRRGLAHAFRH